MRKAFVVPTKKERNRLMSLRKRLSTDQIVELLGISQRTYFTRLAMHGLSAGHRTPSYCAGCGVSLTWLKQNSQYPKNS